jgi:division protein CdvB (Snf7/Vps24/ESCRT-III family)
MKQIDQGSTKTKAEIKKLAKKGDVKNAKILAREVVRASKQKNRLAVSKARLNSIGMQLQHQLGKSIVRTAQSCVSRTRKTNPVKLYYGIAFEQRCTR